MSFNQQKMSPSFVIAEYNLFNHDKVINSPYQTANTIDYLKQTNQGISIPVLTKAYFGNQVSGTKSEVSHRVSGEVMRPEKIFSCNG